MGSFSLTAAVQVFPCPHCYETISNSMQQCRFCARLIDHLAAQASADATSRICEHESHHAGQIDLIIKRTPGYKKA